MTKYTSKTELKTAGGKVAGVIFGDTLRIVKKDKSHFSYKHQGYGIAPETLSEAERLGARYLEIVGYDGEVFNLKIREFIAAAVPDDLGFGRQYFLSLRWLRWYSDRVQAHVNEPQPAALYQPPLFGKG